MSKIKKFSQAIKYFENFILKFEQNIISSQLQYDEGQ